MAKNGRLRRTRHNGHVLRLQAGVKRRLDEVYAVARQLLLYSTP